MQDDKKLSSLPSLHLDCRLGILIMPAGNPLAMVVPVAAHNGNSGSPGAPEQSGRPTIVDAHNVQGISMEDAVAGIARAVPLAMSQEEIMLRRCVVRRSDSRIGKHN